MKRILILFLLLPSLALAFTVPTRPTGFVQDYAKMLSPDQVNQLETKLEAYEKQSTNEIAVVTVPSLDGEPIENLAQEIFTHWGIGKKDKNNGVLLLISLSDRKTRIQTGYGVEGELTDVGTSYIQSDVIAPAFRQGDYYGGINGAVDQMISALGGNEIVPQDYNNNSTDYLGIIFFVVVIFLRLFLAPLLGRTKSWWFGGVLGGVIGIALWWFVAFSLWAVLALILIGLFLDFIFSKNYKRYSGPGGWWGGFGGGSGGGGGFGGFGGGMSGGGGSSGGW